MSERAGQSFWAWAAERPVAVLTLVSAWGLFLLSIARGDIANFIDSVYALNTDGTPEAIAGLQSLPDSIREARREVQLLRGDVAASDEVVRSWVADIHPIVEFDEEASREATDNVLKAEPCLLGSFCAPVYVVRSLPTAEDCYLRNATPLFRRGTMDDLVLRFTEEYETYQLGSEYQHIPLPVYVPLWAGEGKKQFSLRMEYINCPFGPDGKVLVRFAPPLMVDIFSEDSQTDSDQ